MEIRNKVIVITGGAGGIGLAIAKTFLTEDPKVIILADIKFDHANLKNKKVIYKKCNISIELEVNNLIDEINHDFGLIDIFCSNAGILTLGDEQSSNEDWNKNWNLHVMAHVFAAKKLSSTTPCSLFLFLSDWIGRDKASKILSEVGP